ncbi:MAG: hypothetical protein HPY62_00335 [Bacteroidales bacterium]|nr:hypothetical protein [Bacteroidales bacterium]
MKTPRLKFLISVAMLLASSGLICGQTYQYVWHLEFDPLFPGMCINHPIAGSVDYHVTFHINPKTGFVDKQHNNILHSDLTDLQTNEKVICIDSGNDGLNYWGNWDFWNNVTGADVKIEGFWPENGGEGAMVAGAFKWVSKGGVVATMHFIHQVHINANGEVVVDKYKESIECN